MNSDLNTILGKFGVCTITPKISTSIAPLLGMGAAFNPATLIPDLVEDIRRGGQ